MFENFVDVYDTLTSPTYFEEGEAKRIYDIVIEHQSRDYNRRVLTIYYMKVIGLKQYEYLMGNKLTMNKLLSTKFPFFYQKITDRNSKVESTAEYWATGFNKKTLSYTLDRKAVEC